jgi:hypothetical protein
MDTVDQEKPIAGHRALAQFLTEQGFPLSHSSVAKYCSPAINTGPPIEGYWGRLPLFLPSRSLKWARSRVQPAKYTHIPIA